jgi:hypothetical protein
MVKNQTPHLVVHDPSVVSYLAYVRKDNFLIDAFFAGFILYTISYTLAQTDQFSWVICQAFQSMGIGVMFLSALPLIRWRFENNYLRFLYSIYVPWLMIVVLRGFSLDFGAIKVMLFDSYFGALPYFVPLILLFPKNLFFYNRLFDVIMILAFWNIAYDLFFFRGLMDGDLLNLWSQGLAEEAKTMGIPAGFIVLTFSYHTRRRKLIAIGTLLMIFFFATIRGRRGLMLISILPMVFAYLLYLIQGKYRVIGVALTVITGLLIVSFQTASILGESNVFDNVKERGTVNTRLNVEQAFFKDMEFESMIIGRGMNGTYFCPTLIDVGAGTFDRGVIETDYLQIILKGGLISLILLLLILIPAVWKGIFRSRNLLSKAAGIWILYCLLAMYPANLHTFTLFYLIVWVSVGICYSDKLRNMPDAVLKQFFKQKIGFTH